MFLYKVTANIIRLPCLPDDELPSLFANAGKSESKALFACPIWPVPIGGLLNPVMLLNADEMEAASLPIGLCDEGRMELSKL